ncbi:hypothetical protein CDQ83_13695 [Clostridium thermosuccinogenes]|jgi:hypothetical protein|nr:hypothetical protein CDQ83_13695 [Pseudoclostridium thermosuccinogenes]
MIDFEQEFSKFVSSGEGSAIKDIYNIIPSLSTSQIKILNALSYYIKKYDLQDLKELVEDYLKNVSKNKNLNFLSSMNVKNLLKAYTQEELIKGIKINTQSKQEN